MSYLKSVESVYVVAFSGKNRPSCCEGKSFEIHYISAIGQRRVF